MFGTAPAAKIYALKVFPSQGGGAPESRIIAAMDRAITLRRNFNNGASTAPVSGSGTEDRPFQVRRAEHQSRQHEPRRADPVCRRRPRRPVNVEDARGRHHHRRTAAGNDGFGAMTGGSPGTGIGSLTVGASSTPVHERVLRDLQ